MLEKVEQLVEKVSNYTPNSEEELNNFRIEYLGKKGLLNDLFASFREIPNEQKKELDHLNFMAPYSIKKLEQLIH